MAVTVSSRKMRTQNRSIYYSIILFILSILIFSSIIVTPEQSGEDYSETVGASQDKLSDQASLESSNNWTLVEQSDETIEIQPGNDFFVKLSPRAPEGQRLQIKKQIDYNEFLSSTAISAIKETPDWLRDDLVKKFIEISSIELQLNEDVSGAFGDLDGDGDLDLICGSSANELKYYNNKGTSFEPIYIEDKLNLYTEDLDLTGANPIIGDVDNNGCLDIVTGNENGDIIVFFNMGDKNNPVFNNTFAVIGLLGGYSSPCLGDFDGDQDLDLVCGAQDGRIYTYENIYESDGYTTSYPWSNFPYSIEIIDVGDRSKPSLADLDNDGDLDLTIGEGQANINYYRNVGSSQNPDWRLDSSMYTGLTMATQTAPELVNLDGDSRNDLIVGCSDGRFYYFDNIGTILEPQWQIWSSYQVIPGIEYYERMSFLKYINYSYVDQFAELIINAQTKFKDEIAFSIANTPTQVLWGMGSNKGVLKSNAELLYEIDQYLDYADIVEYGDYSSKNYYSTISYKYKSSKNGSIETTELPRDIYYWYIVHPKISDEVPAYINPNTGDPAAPPVGRFWREYLFYHNDSAYPADPPTDPDGNGVPNYHYPKEESPPLLKEKLSGISYIYDSEPYNSPRGYDNQGYNNTRPWGYKDHAIEAVSNWVAKTLPLNEQESADGERPIQPVRIASHHNGNCGELQDLTVAASRTALIPAAAVMLWGEDHVWSEFYERGWHQWDNYWSDGGSVVDNFMNYWVGWNQRGGSGVSKWHGNDFVSDVTEHYVPSEDLSKLIIHVNDRNGNPVDGARVMVGSHWTSLEMSGYQVTIPFPSIWNYTNSYGMCTFKVATQEGMSDGNKNFSFKVISKLGNAEQLKVELAHGQEHEFWFTLDGAKPEAELNHITVGKPRSNERFKLVVDFELEEECHYPPNPWVGNYHPQPITLNKCILGFLCNETNFNYYLGGGYRTGLSVFEYYSTGYCELGETPIYSHDNDNLYFVFYNRKNIETYKRLKLELKLYEIPDYPPKVSIIEPKLNETFTVGDEILIKGHASDDRGIAEIKLLIGSAEGPRLFDVTGSLKNETWEYIWNTTDDINGTYIIKVAAYDTNENYDVAHVYVDLESAPPPPPPDITPPQITITSPKNGTEITIGEILIFKGTAIDNSTISILNLILDSKEKNLLPSLNNTIWSYTWDTQNQDPGEFKYCIYSSDKPGNTIRIYGYVIFKEEIVDYDPPVIIIDSPDYGQAFDQGEQIRFEGSVEDNIGVFSLSLIIDDNPPVGINFSSKDNSWSYVWTSSQDNFGLVEIEFTAVDVSGNEWVESISIYILDITPPEVIISYPLSGLKFDYGAQVEIRGETYDNFEIDNIELVISGNGIREKIRKGINYANDQWSYSWEITDYYPAGQYTISVEAMDVSGNTNTDTTSLTINPKPEPKKDKGMFGLPGFEGILLMNLIVFIISARKIKKNSHKR